MGDIRYGSSDALIHNLLHFGTGKPGVLAVTATDQQRKQKYGKGNQRNRPEVIHAASVTGFELFDLDTIRNRSLQPANILGVWIAVDLVSPKVGHAGEFRRLDFEVSARNLDAATAANALQRPAVANP